MNTENQIPNIPNPGENQGSELEATVGWIINVVLKVGAGRNFSKSFEHLTPKFVVSLDYVITLSAEEICPSGTFAKAKRLHWPIPILPQHQKTRNSNSFVRLEMKYDCGSDNSEKSTDFSHDIQEPHVVRIYGDCRAAHNRCWLRDHGRNLGSRKSGHCTLGQLSSNRNRSFRPHSNVWSYFRSALQSRGKFHRVSMEENFAP